jgi:hypothetical protein
MLHPKLCRTGEHRRLRLFFEGFPAGRRRIFVTQHGVYPMLQFKHFLQEALRFDAAPAGFLAKRLELLPQASTVSHWGRLPNSHQWSLNGRR